MPRRPPYHLGAPFDIVDRNLPPTSGIGRIIAVIAHCKDVPGLDRDGAEVRRWHFVRYRRIRLFADALGVPMLKPSIGEVHEIGNRAFVIGGLRNRMPIDVYRLADDFDRIAFDPDNSLNVVAVFRERFVLEAA